MQQAFDIKTLSDIQNLAERLPVLDKDMEAGARARQDTLTKPPGSLGRLEDIAAFMAGWRGRADPAVDLAQSLVFAGNHGVCAQGISPFPQEVTAAMTRNFEEGGAGINQIAALNGARLSVIPLDLDRPTADFTVAPAMTEAECLDAMRSGMAAVDPKADIVLLGEMGIGNSTVAAALACAVFGGPAADWVGRGTGADDAMLAKKAAVVDAGVALHKGKGAMQLLAALGGREQAAICGAVLAARHNRTPVLLDGFICTGAVTPLFGADPRLLDHCLIGHLSAEAGHRRLIENIGIRPLMDLNMRLGEGTGAALALNIVRAALACHNGMATFAEAGVASA